MAVAKPSTLNPEKLPAPAMLWQQCVSLAIADAILSPDVPSCRFIEWDQGQLFEHRWANGSHVRVAFVAAGVLIKGFDQESPARPQARGGQLWPGLYGAVPRALRALLEDPAMEASVATYCITWSSTMERWMCGVKEPLEGTPGDGSAWQLRALCSSVTTYADWAIKTYERPISRGTLKKIWAQQLLEPSDIESLNNDAKPDKKADPEAVIALANRLRIGVGSPFQG